MSRIPVLIVVLRVVLAVFVVGLGAAFAGRSEPASSSDEAVVDTPAPAPGAPTALPVVVKPTAVTVPGSKRGSPVEYTVCTSNGSWTKPPPEIEAEYLATAAVHATFDDIRAQFRAPFWRDAGNEGSLSALFELTGLWTAANAGLDVSAMIRAGCAASPASRSGLVNIWLLGYVADDVRIEDGRILVFASPKRGFQTIQLRFTGSENPKIMPIDFYSPSGFKFEAIPANSTWSTQQ